MLRTTLPFALFAALSLSACTFLEEPLGGSHPGATPTPAPAPTSTAVADPNMCAQSLGTCADYDTWLAKPVRPRPHAVVAYTTANGETDIALYEDGTLLSRVSAKSRGYENWYWDLGDVRSKVSAATMKDILASIAAAKSPAFARPFFGAGHGSPVAADTFTFDDGGVACASRPLPATAPSSCEEPQPLSLLRWELDVLSAAAHEKWVSANEGTIALMGEVHPAPWPLDASLATRGNHELGASDYALLADNDTWTLPDGTFVLAGRWSVTYGGGRTNYEVLVSDVEAPAVVPDTPATLRADLLATNGKLGWSAEWLGMDADRTVFSTFKGKRIAVFPKTDTDGSTTHVYRLAAFEHRDVTADGDL